MAEHVRTCAGVRSWPAAPDARAALAEYLDALGPDPLRVTTALVGDSLDFTGADLLGLDLNSAGLFGADLRGCSFGPVERPASARLSRLAGCRMASASGHVAGPVDVGADESRLLDGPDLLDWFRSLDAPDVRVASSG